MLPQDLAGDVPQHGLLLLPLPVARLFPPKVAALSPNHVASRRRPSRVSVTPPVLLNQVAVGDGEDEPAANREAGFLGREHVGAVGRPPKGVPCREMNVPLSLPIWHSMRAVYARC